jgi:hypothetical protein
MTGTKHAGAQVIVFRKYLVWISDEKPAILSEIFVVFLKTSRQMPG